MATAPQTPVVLAVCSMARAVQAGTNAACRRPRSATRQMPLCVICRGARKNGQHHAPQRNSSCDYSRIGAQDAPRLPPQTKFKGGVPRPRHRLCDVGKILALHLNHLLQGQGACRVSKLTMHPLTMRRAAFLAFQLLGPRPPCPLAAPNRRCPWSCHGMPGHRQECQFFCNKHKTRIISRTAESRARASVAGGGGGLGRPEPDGPEQRQKEKNKPARKQSNARRLNSEAEKDTTYKWALSEDTYRRNTR